ncbi:MAG: type II toxin-antitoxin system VapC family toxin [Gammaproteobacteria bacterium]|nr:MAG: type II toxin-antitoxin system VapC family toxin [Gammaproteobacteria bacterium]
MALLMLDTDISSYVIRHRPASVAERFEHYASELCVSVVTAAELRFGAEKAARPELARLVEAYLARLAILDWTDAVTFHYARIRAALERAGKPIGNLDLMIASHAVAEEATVVTNNVRHFASVPGLKVEEWK